MFSFPFETVLVANRGAIARRILRTCRELGLKTIAVHAPGDLHPEWLTLADQVVEIPDLAEQSAYLNIQALVAVAKTHQAAIHPGYGFLSENADFARACLDAGLVWIGPGPAVLELSGNKVRCFEFMQLQGLPVLPVLSSGDHSADFQAQLEDMGFPLLLKPSHGGGGIGMQRVEKKEDLQEALDSTLELARRYFSESTLLAEPWLSKVRHIEVQVVADHAGAIQTLFERECSLQRRCQKVIEEAPAPDLSEQQRQELYDLAVCAAEAMALDQLATVEFLWDGQQFWFLEVNPRLQVEHAITEAITGLDLVEVQLRLAAGAELNDLKLPLRYSGHAFEARVYAEEPWSGLPAPGKVLTVNLPDGAGIRIERAVYAGMPVSAHFDPLLMKVIAFGPDRDRARRRLILALEELELVGDADFVTNQSSLLQALNCPDVITGDYHTQSFEALQTQTPPEVPELHALINGLTEAQRRPQSDLAAQSQFWRPAHWI